MQTTLYGLDIAKRVFQLYWVEPETGEVINRKFSRKKLIEFFSNRVSGTVAVPPENLIVLELLTITHSR